MFSIWRHADRTVARRWPAGRTTVLRRLSPRSVYAYVVVIYVHIINTYINILHMIRKDTAAVRNLSSIVFVYLLRDRNIVRRRWRQGPRASSSASPPWLVVAHTVLLYIIRLHVISCERRRRSRFRGPAECVLYGPGGGEKKITTKTRKTKGTS